MNFALRLGICFVGCLLCAVAFSDTPASKGSLSNSHKNGLWAAVAWPFPAAPALPSERLDAPTATLLMGRTRGLVGTPWARLVAVSDGDGTREADAYVIAEIWTGETWRRAGTLYPLASVVVERDDLDGQPETLRVLYTGFASSGARLQLEGVASAEDGRRWPVRIAIAYTDNPARFEVIARFGAPKPTKLLAFDGPCARTGAQGEVQAKAATKDFVLFPGITYVEGAESATSAGARAPEPYEIRSPVMAVQAGDALMAMIWDMNQAWAPEQRRPAACLRDAGPGGVSMALSAPGIGPLRRPDASQADKPYTMKVTEHVQVAYTLVLDSKARYDVESIAQKRRGGLLLQALQHYLDLRGGLPPAQSGGGLDGDLLTQETLKYAQKMDGWLIFGAYAMRQETDICMPLALDATKNIKGQNIPRDAQGQPSLFAAAQTVRAYCDQYRRTGDASDLTEARYWAWAGLTQVYLWDTSVEPGMHYMTSAAERGLVYAYALRELARLDDSFPWENVARGVTNNTMQWRALIRSGGPPYQFPWQQMLPSQK